MGKYKSAHHQDIAVWARRANITVPDLDVAVQFIKENLGAGRRGTLRLLGMMWTKRNLSEDNVQITRTLGIALGDMVYDVSYGKCEFVDIDAVAIIQRQVGFGAKADQLVFDRRHLDFVVAAAQSWVMIRDAEKDECNNSLAGMLRNAVHGAC